MPRGGDVAGEMKNRFRWHVEGSECNQNKDVEIAG